MVLWTQLKLAPNLITCFFCYFSSTRYFSLFSDIIATHEIYSVSPFRLSALEKNNNENREQWRHAPFFQKKKSFFSDMDSFVKGIASNEDAPFIEKSCHDTS